MSRGLPLGDLLADVEVTRIIGDDDVVVSGLEHDSRAVGPGTLFAALPGANVDGHGFLRAAARAGAVAALVERPEPGLGMTQVVVPDTRAALPWVARAMYRDPSSRLRVVGVTGTNGKTTVTHLIRDMVSAAGLAGGLVGTLGYGARGDLTPTPNTTPESDDLQRILASMVDDRVDVVALEVSSHATAGHRVDGLRFAVRVFTNLSRDHLDFHGDMERYFLAKRRLFTEFGGGPSWANLDDPWGRRLAAEAPGVLGFSLAGAGEAAVRVLSADAGPRGIRAEVETPAGLVRVDSPLVGRFNLENLLAAISVGVSLGLEPGAMGRGLSESRGAAGRMEPVPDPLGQLHVLVDYAHTPDALDRALAELGGPRGVTVVFGCGGDRDRGKRPHMGRVAERRCSRVILTDDNPRSEDGEAIVQDILGGMEAPSRATVVRDRREAIRLAIGQARPGEVILIAGKGAERYQERDGVKHPFSDVVEAARALAERSGGLEP